MQRDQHFYTKRVITPFATHMHTPVASSFGEVFPPAAKPPMPFHGVEFQPSEVYPKNFIIFDQTDHRSQIMFHPAIAQKFNCPSLNFCESYFQNNFERNDATNVQREMSSSLKEDSDDIDALLSLEDEEEGEEEYDEEEVSTARTCGDYGSNSPDSSSTSGSELQMNKSSLMLKSSGSSSKCNNERKLQKMKKMVKVLRGIVPGGDQMNTVAVLDEAVRYLKSLKVEVQKQGVRNFKD